MPRYLALNSFSFAVSWPPRWCSSWRKPWVISKTGATNPRAAAPGTIRGDLGTIFTENLVHGSDSADSAARELEIFFPGFAKRIS